MSKSFHIDNIINAFRKRVTNIFTNEIYIFGCRYNRRTDYIHSLGPEWITRVYKEMEILKNKNGNWEWDYTIRFVSILLCILFVCDSLLPHLSCINNWNIKCYKLFEFIKHFLPSLCYAMWAFFFLFEHIILLNLHVIRWNKIEMYTACIMSSRGKKKRKLKRVYRKWMQMYWSTFCRCTL